MSCVRTFRLHRKQFWVDVRLYELNGLWVASSDAPNGPTLGLGFTPRGAIMMALAPFVGAITDLLSTAPADLEEGQA